MAVGAWTFYNKLRKNLGIAKIDLVTPNVRMALFLSTSNAATATLSTYGSLSNQVANANGYATSGLICSTHSYTAGASAGSMRFNINAKQWKASGGTITGIKFAVLFLSGASAGAKKLICYSQLSTANFNLTSGNTITITPAATGVFNLT